MSPVQLRPIKSWRQTHQKYVDSKLVPSSEMSPIKLSRHIFTTQPNAYASTVKVSIPVSSKHTNGYYYYVHWYNKYSIVDWLIVELGSTKMFSHIWNLYDVVVTMKTQTAHISTPHAPLYGTVGIPSGHFEILS